VQYKKLLLESPKLKSSEIFKAIEIAIPSTEIEAAILKAKAKEKRHRGLPSQLVVCLIIAMSLWSKDSVDVLKNLIDGVNEVWLKTGKYWKIPCKAAITKARKRLKPLVMS
jgi:hypothetical protein